MRWLALTILFLGSIGLVWLLPCYLWLRRHGEIPAWLAMSGLAASIVVWMVSSASFKII